MIQNKDEYIKFLIQIIGVQENTAKSYVSYLESVSKSLNIKINFSTVSSEANVTSIKNKLLETDFQQSYQKNCVTALKKYLKFRNRVKIPNEIVNQNQYPDEIVNSDQYPEGGKKTIIVNYYERNTEARNRCIEINGLNCAVCNINFEEVYGVIGKGFIHVHHVKPLSEIDTNYNVNPETDLVPVCPNCHAMLHRKEYVISIESLKEMYDNKIV